MKKIILFAIIFTFSLNLFAQTEEIKSPLDGRNYGVVYDIPATKNVTVKTDVPYAGNLTIDVYSPPNAKPNDRFPAVIFLNAIGDAPNQMKVKKWGIYSSFPRLVAAHGMIGISMDMDGGRIQENLKGLFDFLEKDGVKYGIDSTRLGVYAASANVTQGSIYLLGENVSKNIKAAVLYYGGVPNSAFRRDLPVLFVIAEGDMVRNGQQYATLWQKVSESRAPWTVMFASRMPHAFDAFADNDESRRIIQQTIAFWKSNLEPVPQPSWKPSFAREIVASSYDADSQKTADLLSKWIAQNPKDVVAYQQYGRVLSQLRRFDEANTAYEKALEYGGTDAGIYLGLAQMRFGQKRYEEAAANFAKAIEGGARNSQVYGQLAFTQMFLNRNEEAIKSYEKAFEAGIPPGANTRGIAYYNMACAYVRLKQTDKAFEMLNKAVDEGFANRNTLETDEDMKPIREDSRFQQLLTRLPKNTTSN
ncbi:MAG: tetratricopeptide repeat protein [Pyrinomonadaceae bacterium]|nr:tetratricopeptide repeat protein [Pyrinomonadaceae bacterium]